MDLLLNYWQTTQHYRNIVIYQTIQICLCNASSMKLHKNKIEGESSMQKMSITKTIELYDYFIMTNFG